MEQRQLSIIRRVFGPPLFAVPVEPVICCCIGGSRCNCVYGLIVWLIIRMLLFAALSS